MALRATWKGSLKLSLVTIPIRLYNATTSANRISLNQLHKECKSRLKQQMVCPTHGAVERDDIIKGYEFEQDKYVVIDQADLDKIKLEANKAIELTSFVDASEVDALYLDGGYYVAPDGPIAEEAFAVVREALRQTGKAGLGRVTMLGRERLVVITPEDKGFRMMNLRTHDEVRAAAPCFEDVADKPINDAMLGLAKQLIAGMPGAFEPAKFVDRYQEQLLAVIKAKIAGQEPTLVQEQEVAKAFSFMDALKASVGAAPAAAPEAPAPAAEAKPERKPAAKSVPAKETAAKGKRKQA